MDLQTYLIVGSYLMGAASWAFLFREIKALRNELVSLRIQLAQEQGKDIGYNHEQRISRLERLCSERFGH